MCVGIHNNHLPLICIPQAVAKIREFCMTKINQFKKPMANYQITQNTLLKFK